MQFLQRKPFEHIDTFLNTTALPSEHMGVPSDERIDFLKRIDEAAKERFVEYQKWLDNPGMLRIETAEAVLYEDIKSRIANGILFSIVGDVACVGIAIFAILNNIPFPSSDSLYGHLYLISGMSITGFLGERYATKPIYNWRMKNEKNFHSDFTRRFINVIHTIQKIEVDVLNKVLSSSFILLGKLNRKLNSLTDKEKIEAEQYKIIIKFTRQLLNEYQSSRFKRDVVEKALK